MESTATPSESEINGWKDTISNYQTLVANNRERIAQLDAVQKKIGEIKWLDVETVKRQWNNSITNLESSISWVGRSKNGVVSDMYHLSQDWMTYQNNIDRLQDDICDEITRLENENLIFGDSINTLWDKIKKACN